jgi:DNA-binding NtrC family response regulator
VREREVEHIVHALRLTGGHRSQTAELLGISRKVLWEKIRDFGIEVPGTTPATGGSGTPEAAGADEPEEGP